MTTWALQILLSVTLIAACALIASVAARRRPALVLAIASYALGACLLLPGLSWVSSRANLVSFRIEAPERTGPAVPSVPAYDSPDFVSAEDLIAEQTPPVPEPPPNWTATFASLYFAGVFVMIGWLGVGVWMARRFVRRSTPLTPAQIETLWQIDHIERFTDVRVTTDLDTPAVVGFVKPILLMPSGALERLNGAELAMIVGHEAEHVRGRHAWLGLMQRVTCALYWPHLLVHLLSSRLGRAQEELCDGAALRAGTSSQYARVLLTLAGNPCPAAGLVHGIGGPRISLESRIRGLLDPQRSNIPTMNMTTRLALVATSFAVTFALAGIQIGEAQEPVLAAGQEVSIASAPVIEGPIQYNEVPVVVGQAKAARQDVKLKDLKPKTKTKLIPKTKARRTKMKGKVVSAAPVIKTVGQYNLQPTKPQLQWRRLPTNAAPIRWKIDPAKYKVDYKVLELARVRTWQPQIKLEPMRIQTPTKVQVNVPRTTLRLARGQVLTTSPSQVSPATAPTTADLPAQGVVTSPEPPSARPLQATTVDQPTPTPRTSLTTIPAPQAVRGVIVATPSTPAVKRKPIHVMKGATVILYSDGTTEIRPPAPAKTAKKKKAAPKAKTAK